MSKISIIVAASKNMVIGKSNDLPWNLPTDLKNFKNITQGKMVIMGRKCWESIPSKFRPLPNRDNVVITRNFDYLVEGGSRINDISTLLHLLKLGESDDEVFVIGGAQIYKEAFPYADKLYLTQILNDVEGDVYLEGLDFNEWELIESSENIIENGIEYKFTTFNRILNGRREKEGSENTDN